MGLSSSRVPATLNHPQAKFVQQAVAQNCVVIFSKTTCPFCVQTKEIFRNLGIPYTAVELNNHPQGPEIQNYLADVTQARTVSSSMFPVICLLFHFTYNAIQLASTCIRNLTLFDSRFLVYLSMETALGEHQTPKLFTNLANCLILWVNVITHR